MLFKFKSYFKFLIKSTNQHGIHSPYVFDYLTKCLYLKPKKSKDKTIDILFKSITYFNAKSITIMGNVELQTKIQQDFSDLSEQQAPVDILYFDSPLNENSTMFFSNFQLHNDSLVIFRGIYRSPEDFAAWKEFVKNEKVSVSIDFFHCGLFFVRKEQVKQHFTIRI